MTTSTRTTGSERAASPNGTLAPITVVSSDTHVGPSLSRQLRAYCDAAHLEAFDDYVAGLAKLEEELEQAAATQQASGVHADPVFKATMAPTTRDLPTHIADGGDDGSAITQGMAEARVRSSVCEGLQDPYARLRDLDADGVAAEVIYAGGQNGEGLPFMNAGFETGANDTLAEKMDRHQHWKQSFIGVQGSSPLSAVGLHIYNRWLADFVSVEPERHVGLMHVPIWDIDATVAELRWGREHGLRGVNFPAPRRGLLPYNHPAYEPLWAAAEELQLPLCTHAGAGDIASGTSGPGGFAVAAFETPWLGRRALAPLILGGVFERHPGLKFVLTEQFLTWIPETLRDLDSLYYNDVMTELRSLLPHPPSHYWEQNCFIGSSFMARFEAEERDTVGVGKLMWGSDYPHIEGTWPHTMKSLRTTFHGLPEADVRRMLGGNAIDVYGLDAPALAKVAARIGPRLEELSQPAGDLPSYRGFAFRERGNFS